MDEWFAQNPLMGALGGVIALGILIYMLVIMTRNVGGRFTSQIEWA
jgi:hypothetical protein